MNKEGVHGRHSFQTGLRGLGFEVYPINPSSQSRLKALSSMKALGGWMDYLLMLS